MAEPLQALSNAMESNPHSKLPDLTGLVTRSKVFPSAYGGFADIWEENWGNLKVAVKVLRPSLEDEEAKGKLKKRLCRELSVWRKLSHGNVLPLLGVVSDFGPYTSMVCPWMAGGTLNTYLERFKTTLTLFDKFTLLSQVAAGLSYLHSREVIHGDLTGRNILIDDEGAAFLSDFGLSIISAEFQGASYFTSNICGSVRYAAPEIYAVTYTPNSPISTHSDVYSFGSIMLQTLSCRVPYHDLRNDAMVLLEVHNGNLHKRPPEPWFTDNYWEFIVKCWDRTPHNRPTMEEVVSHVHNCYLATSAQPGCSHGSRSVPSTPDHSRHTSYGEGEPDVVVSRANETNSSEGEMLPHQQESLEQAQLQHMLTAADPVVAAAHPVAVPIVSPVNGGEFNKGSAPVGSQNATFVCPLFSCGKPFKRMDLLTRHLQTHTMERTYECPTCYKRFSRSDDLNGHMYTVHAGFGSRLSLGLGLGADLGIGVGGVDGYSG